jgi:hypothetical protein
VVLLEQVGCPDIMSVRVLGPTGRPGELSFSMWSDGLCGKICCQRLSNGLAGR